MMLLFFFISLIVPLASVNNASALTPQQLQDCYFYNGKTVGSLVSSTSSGNTTAPNYTFQECQDMGACQKPASNTATISCANPTQQQAVDTKLGSAITTICGPSNAIGAAYNNCVNDVTNAYNACKNASTSTAAVDGTKEQAIAACIAGRVAGVNVGQLSTALTGSQAAAATLYSNERSCVQANGQWDAAAGTCNTDNRPESPTCEGGSWGMNWIFCPIYEGLSSASGWVLEHVLVPQLRTSPLCLNGTGQGCATKHTDPIYQIWSSFRTYGNIFLIIALLVVIFGEVIGGGVIEAYTVKKVLPRLLIGAVLINLSIYLVAIMIDITNIIGNGIMTLITSPLKDQGLFMIRPEGVATNLGVFGGAAGGIILGAGSVAGLFSISGAVMLLDVVLVPVFLIFIAILAVLAIRKAVIIALVLVAPLAFALYCLPNTEKYFKKWWEVLLEMLMVYPIIMLFFALSSVMSVIIEFDTAGNDSATGAINAVLSLIFTILPLFLIPMAFKIAGSTLGSLMGAVDGIREKANGLGQNRKERALNNFKDKNIQDRQNRTAFLNKQASKGGTLRQATLGRALRTASRAYGGYNIEGEAAARRAAKMKQAEDQIASGDDKDYRGLTVNKQAALAAADGENNLWRMHEGRRQFRSLGGAWIDEANVDAGHRRWGDDNFIQQAALGYEMRKANTDEDRARVANGYQTVARRSRSEGGWGMSEQQAGGAWIGAAFANQNNNLQYKYVRQNRDGSVGFDHEGFVQEVYEKRNSYGMSNMDATTIQRLTEAADKGTVPQEQLVAIAQTMQDRLSGARSGATSIQPTGADGAAEPSASSMGAGHVSQEMNRFVTRVLGRQQPRQQ